MNHDINNVGVRPHLSTGQNILRKILRKNTEERQILTLSIEKSFWTVPLTTNNATYRDSLILSHQNCWSNICDIMVVPKKFKQKFNFHVA